MATKEMADQRQDPENKAGISVDTLIQELTGIHDLSAKISEVMMFLKQHPELANLYPPNLLPMLQSVVQQKIANVQQKSLGLGNQRMFQQQMRGVPQNAVTAAQVLQPITQGQQQVQQLANAFMQRFGPQKGAQPITNPQDMALRNAIQSGALHNLPYYMAHNLFTPQMKAGAGLSDLKSALGGGSGIDASDDEYKSAMAKIAQLEKRPKWKALEGDE